MRVLVVLSRLESSGGIGRVAFGTAQALARRGHELHVAGPPDGHVAPEVAGVEVHAWPRRSQKLGQLGTLLRLQRRLRAEHVHFHSALPHGELIAGLRAARALLGRPRLYVTPWTSLRVGYPKRRARLGLRAADAVIAPSRWSAGHALRAGADPATLHVVQGGVTPVSSPPSEARDPAVLFLGRLAEVKGADLLLRAFSRAAEERPDWRLWICGAGRDAETLRAFATRLPCSERIEFLGHVRGAAKRAVLERAAIGAMPSEAESMGGSLLEFQAFGLACVASDAGALPELAQHGEAAVLVPPRDTAALAGALAALMDDPERRRLLGDAGRRASRGFSWDAVAERTEAVYRGDPPAPGRAPWEAPPEGSGST